MLLLSRSSEVVLLSFASFFLSLLVTSVLRDWLLVSFDLSDDVTPLPLAAGALATSATGAHAGFGLTLLLRRTDTYTLRGIPSAPVIIMFVSSTLVFLTTKIIIIIRNSNHAMNTSMVTFSRQGD